jgi:hypothetical protein
MQKTAARTGQLVRWNAKHGVRYVQTAEFGVAKDLERRFGQIYAIIVVDANPRAGEALFAHIEDSFSRGALEAARRCAPDATHEMLFETAVSHVNSAVTRALGDRGLGIEPEYVSAAIVAVQGREIVAAIWGRPSILLYHPTSRGLIAYDLVGDAATAANGRRCFGSVIAGRIGDGDRLLLATQDVRDILTDDAASSAMSAADPAMATKLLRDALAPMEEEITIAIMALDVAPIRYLEDMQGSRSVTTQSSLADLRRVESRTEEILSSSPLASIQKTVAHAASAMRGSKHEASAVTPSDTVEPRRKEISVSGALIAAGAGTARGVLALAKSIISTDWRTLPARTAAGFDTGADRAVARLNALGPLRKRLLLGIMLAVLALNSTVLVGDWKTSLDELASASEKRVLAIKQKVDSAEASLIYRDEARAKALLAEASAEAAALPAKSNDEKEAKAGIESRIAAAQDALRHAVPLGAPQVVSTIAVSDGSATRLTRLATAGGALWGVSSNGELFRITPTDGAAQKAATLASEARIVLPITSGVLAAAETGSATIVPASGQGSAKDVRIDAQGAAIADADTWNGRLYVLDPSHNRILRLDADAQGYAGSQFYLKDGTDVSKATSLAIDGGVWVLAADGAITKLIKGAREPFAAASVDPAITAARRIRTTPESDSLFVLDADPGRIIRFDKKSGALVAQYVSPALAGATDFTVDEPGKTLLVTVGNQVLKFGLPE